MNMIRVTKTWRGYDAKALIESAEIARMAAGTYEITSPLLPGHILDMTTNEEYLVVTKAAGACCRIAVDGEEAEILLALLERREEAYTLGES